jgi:hypothetical protein
MDAVRRKQAIAAYKKREPAVGIFAVRCLVSGEIWTGQTLNLESIRNRIWFVLRLGGHPNGDLQRAWSAHGEDSFTFEELERLSNDDPPYIRDAILKERDQHWRQRLRAAAL